MGLSGATMPLNDAARRLEAVLDNATVAIFLMDGRQHCVFMNRAAEELTGYRFAEVEAMDCPLHDIIHHSHPDGTPFPIEECAIDRAFPEHARTHGEATFVHRDGSFYPVSFMASPIRDAASATVGTIIEVRDIRQEKLAEERQRLLVNELNHRVKNTLATVQSLAWQTFRSGDKDALQRFEGRLSTLSRAHDILTGSAWQSASLLAVVGAALQAFGDERVTFSGPDLAVPPKVAVSLSMVLHELGTNAIKYGSLSALAGQVRLEWTVERHEGHSRLALTWIERGGPETRPPAHRGFGLRLIERQLAMEFEGTSEFDFGRDGLVCRIGLSVPDVADARPGNAS